MAASGQFHSEIDSLRLTLTATMPLVLFIYDILLTFGHEVDWFWTSRMTSARTLFFANRSISLFWIVFNMILYSSSLSDKASYQALWLVEITDTPTKHADSEV